MTRAPVVEGLFSLLGLGAYLVFIQHMLSCYVFHKPEDSWLGKTWDWTRGYRHRSWYLKVGKRYEQPGKAEPSGAPDAI